MLLQSYMYREHMTSGDVTDTVVLSSIILYGFIVIISAIALAVKLNPGHPILMGAVAFLFPELYLTQYVFRKFVLA